MDKLLDCLVGASLLVGGVLQALTILAVVSVWLFYVTRAVLRLMGWP